MGGTIGMVMGNQIPTRDRGCELAEDTVAHNRRVLGEDHPHTLASAISLATTLRELEEHERARELDEDTLTHCCRALGDGHPDTLRSADNLANDLRKLGEDQRAGELEEWINSQQQS